MRLDEAVMGVRGRPGKSKPNGGLLPVQLLGALAALLGVDRQGRGRTGQQTANTLRERALRLLDQRALAIVRAASPFGAFTAAMRANADQLVVTSRFRFTREDGLETTLSGR